MDYLDILHFLDLPKIKKKEYMTEHASDKYFRKILYYYFNPYLNYGVTEESLLEAVKPFKETVSHRLRIDDVTDACKFLIKNKPTRRYCLAKVGGYLYNLYDKREFDFCIKFITRNLKFNIGVDYINSAIPGLIPSWGIQLAGTYEKDAVPPNTFFWLTQEVNGVRGTYLDGRIYSRNGVPFIGLDGIIKDMKFADENNLVIDGMIVIKSRPNWMTDNEANRIAKSLFESKGVERDDLKFVVTDIIPRGDFLSEKQEVKYKYRRSLIDRYRRKITSDKLSFLPVLYKGKDQLMIQKMLSQAESEGKSGLILHLDCPYRKTRSSGTMRVTPNKIEDLQIIDFIEGVGRNSGKLGSILVLFGGTVVGISVGYSEEQRSWIWKKRRELKKSGALCEVKHQGITYDKHTGIRNLRYPVFVKIKNVQKRRAK